jgi:hypothetical protein
MFAMYDGFWQDLLITVILAVAGFIANSVKIAVDLLPTF